MLKEMLTDQVTPFMSKVLKDLCWLFNMKQLRTSVHHPQTDGIVEHFNILNPLLKKVVDKDVRNWDQLLPSVFVLNERGASSIHWFLASLSRIGDSAEISLTLQKNLSEDQQSPDQGLVEHVETMHANLKDMSPIVKEHMAQA